MMKPTKISRTVKVQYTRIYEYEKLVEMGVKTKKNITFRRTGWNSAYTWERMMKLKTARANFSGHEL